MIGEALGAAHGHSPEKEIGKFPITLIREGQANPKFAASEAEFVTRTDDRFVQQPDALRHNDYSEMNGQLFGFLDKLEIAYVARQGATSPVLDVQQHIASVLAFYAVAEHSWMMSLLAILMADKLAQPIDTGKTLKMVIVHDLVESIAGDILYFEVSDRKANKAALEAAAMGEIVRRLPVAAGQ